MQANLKCIKNAVSPDFPGYLMNNPDYKIRASVSPKA